LETFFEGEGSGWVARFAGFRTPLDFAFGFEGRLALAVFLGTGRAPRFACFLE